MNDPLRLPFTLHQFALSNGLRVVLNEDHHAPIVAVNLWYHVGSKNEKPGRTGFAHLFEHLLFQGSEHVGDNQHFSLIQERGGTANGSTWFDRTNYHETLPARELDLALWLEADRMGFFLPAITQDKLDNQRDVVKNERRFRVDNQPYGTAFERAFELLFPADHPYRWPVIGYMPDLDAASLEDVTDFFKRFYLPGNAVLSVVGDIEPGRAEELVRRHFGAIPRGPDVPPVTARFVPPARERRLWVEDALAQIPKLFLLWGIPPLGTADYYALDFLTDLLSSGKSSRLYRRLVAELELAKDVTAFTFNTEETGVLGIVATPRPGIEVERLLGEIDRDLERARREAPAIGEMARTLNRIETAFVGRLDSAESKADLLSMYTTYFQDPYRITSEVERYRALGPEAVRDAARRWLDPDARVCLVYHPRASAESVAVAPGEDRARIPGSAADRPYRFPRPTRAVLGNGLKVVVSPIAKLPLVAATALLDAGSARDPQGQEGLAALAATLLDEGTATRSAAELAEAIESLGAALSSYSDLDSASVTLSGLGRNFPEAFALAAEVLGEPSFPQRELNRLKAEHLAQLVENRSSPGGVAEDLVEQLLFAEHPYAHPLLGREDSLKSIDRDAVTRFSAAHHGPRSTVLLVAGAVDPEQVVALAETRLGAWRSTAVPPAPLPEPVASGRRRVYLLDRPGAPQSELRLANLGIARSAAEYTGCEVLNGILGGKFTSRINLNLREEHGYTYGARSGFAARRVRGPFSVATAVHAEATLPALEEIFKELARIRDEPVSDRELDETRSYLQGIFPLTVETIGEVVGRLAELELYGLGDDWFDTYRERIGGVTAGEVQRLARAHIRPDEMIVLVVGPADSLRSGLERWGEVRQIDDLGQIVG